jgi:hypothetical protein
MLTFKTKIYYPYVLGYCATANCHGGANAKGLFLFTKDHASDSTVYTNFYILSNSNGRMGAMIDRDRPGDSLLIHYGMSPVNTPYPHPQVSGWQPAFADQGAVMPRAILSWVRHQLRHGDWRYPINYDLPLPGVPTTQPARPAAPVQQ